MKKFEIILIGFILALSVTTMGIITFHNRQQDSYVVVTVDNKVAKEIKLSKEPKSQIYEFEYNHNQGYVEVKDGKVRMLEMNKELCPKSICSKTGWIENSYQSIICLPNKIAVTIHSKNMQDENKDNNKNVDIII